MNQAILLGPLALELGVLVAFAAIALGWFVAGRAGRLERDAPLYAVLAAGLVAARAAYVLQHGAGYASAPLSVLDVRDGGWSAPAGFLGAGIAAALLALRWRRLLAPLALGVATAAGVWFAADGAAALLAPPARMPGLTLRSLDGRPVALDAFKGRPVVVNLWATWCPPCIREMPVLQQAQRERRELQFVFVNQGEPADRVQAFLARRELALENVLLDASGELALRMDQRALPTTFFFDREGRLVDVRIGQLTAGALGAKLSALASASAP